MSHLLWLDSGKHKPWVGEIQGFNRRFGLAREFLAPVDKREGARCYLLEEGKLYQVSPAEGDRQFMAVRGGKAAVLDTEEAMRLVEGMEAARRKSSDQVDSAIRRVNYDAEGGFSEN